MIKKKITIVIDASRNRSGGAVVYLKNFLKHLDIRKTKIKKIIIFTYKDLLNKLPNRTFIIKKSHPFLEKNLFFEILWQLIILPVYLRKNKIDILYSTDSTSFCKYNPNIVFNQDILSFDKESYQKTSLGFYKIRLYLIRFFQIRALNNANEIFFLSNFSKKLVSKSLKKNLSFQINHHGVEKKLIKFGKKIQKNLNWCYKTKDKIKLIYVSPLFNYKNHLTVAKAYNKLKKKYKNLDIKFIGNFSCNYPLYQKIINENKHITEKNFLGEVNHTKVIKILSKSDIFIFASSCETFGISLLEAMVLKVPIVCSNKSSMPEILKNCGVYFNPKNYLQLSNQIDKVIKNKKLRRDKCINAYKLSKSYSWDKNTYKFCKIVNKLTS